MVAKIVEQNKDCIVALCRKYQVRALWVFGSAVTSAWNAETSDIDFLVDLGEYDDTVAARYLDLADELERLVGRRIDLVSIGGLRRKCRLREELEQTRVAIYERDHAAAPA